jgi:hypothetical protein
MHERTKRLLESSDHYLDRYPWEGNCAPPLDKRAIAHFQKQINKICGLALSGFPNVRLIWPADPNPDISMTVIDGEKRARYCIYSHEYQCEKVSESGVVGVETITVDIVPQRWIIEDFDEPSQSYNHLFTIGHHDERCCEGSESVEGHLCYGLYREPEQWDIERLQQLAKAREEYRYIVKSGEPISWGEMQDWLSRLRTWKETAERVTKERYKQAIISGLMPMRPRLFSDDPTVHANGKYHWLSGHNKSGTPKNN